MSLPSHYQRVAEGDPSGAGGDLWSSEEPVDGYWDALLEGSAEGQFQQSSAWARYKAGEGWRVRRFVVARDGEASGGFQVLWKRASYGALGYISKGPVGFGTRPADTGHLLRVATGVARRLGVLGLVVQAPDVSTASADDYAGAGFVAERMLSVINATMWVDLAGTEDALWQRMPGSNRTKIRAAQRKGVVIREAGEADLRTFFELMLHTCRRQKTHPNPATEESLRRLWQAFGAGRSIRITLALVDGQPVAGLLALMFGRRLTIWKKGWSSERSECRPNHLLYFEALAWAQKHEFEICDFAGMRMDIARALLAGSPVSAEQGASRDAFHLGFGGHPRLLPPSMIHLPNPVVRFGYGLASGCRTALKKKSLLAKR